MARWKACEWTFGTPGTAMPGTCRAPRGVVSDSTDEIHPPESTPMRTSWAQPVGRSAESKNRSDMVVECRLAWNPTSNEGGP